MLLDRKKTIQTQYYENEPGITEENEKGKEILGPITLSQDDKNCLYQPWSFKIIKRIFGRRMSYHLIRS